LYVKGISIDLTACLFSGCNGHSWAGHYGDGEGGASSWAVYKENLDGGL